jgi:2'-5' RNA ligase
MQNVKYDYSSTHIDVPEPLASELIDWGKKKIKDADIFVSQTDTSFGREDEMHVTVLYGIHSDLPDEVTKIVSGQNKISVKLGDIDVFTNPEKFDVVVVKVISDDLNDLNEKLTKHVEFTNKYKEYKPHITLAYVKKGKGWKYHGLDKWRGKEFDTDYVIFSSKNGTKQKLKV